VNYFSALSLWIANLGVVPWLSFAFFLFLPAFFSFRALLVLVCCVLEAIFSPFFVLLKIIFLKREFLSFRGHIVKVFLVACALFGTATEAKVSKPREFFLAKGEQIELNIDDLASFSMGNKEVLGSRYYAAKRKLLVKGKSLGFSDLVVWDNKGSKTDYHFYVVSKREQLTNFQLANDFKSLGLEVKAMAYELLVRGELTTMEDLRLYNLYMKNNGAKLINMVSLSEELAKELIAGVYLTLGPKATKLICAPVKTNIECLYEGLSPDSAVVRRAEAKYSAIFIPHSHNFKNSNFKVELKVVRTDKGSLQKIGLGLETFSSKVGNILNSGKEALIENNVLNLSREDLKGRIVTSPALLTSIDSPGEIQLGAEIPVVNQNQYGAQSTTWKFAGLKLLTKLSLKESSLAIGIESELTHPTQGLIRGSKSKAVFFPKLGEYALAFQVKYRIDSEGKKGVPGLSDVPLLGALFSSYANNKTEQWLVGYVKVTRAK